MVSFSSLVVPPPLVRFCFLSFFYFLFLLPSPLEFVWTIFGGHICILLIQTHSFHCSTATGLLVTYDVIKLGWWIQHGNGCVSQVCTHSLHTSAHTHLYTYIHFSLTTWSWANQLSLILTSVWHVLTGSPHTPPPPPAPLMFYYKAGVSVCPLVQLLRCFSTPHAKTRASPTRNWRKFYGLGSSLFPFPTWERVVLVKVLCKHVIFSCLSNWLTGQGWLMRLRLWITNLLVRGLSCIATFGFLTI